jgi:tRNA(Glu) U13 pseudouridine synthase TruD
MIEKLKRNPEASVNEIAELEEALDKPGANEAYFTVRFKKWTTGSACDVLATLLHRPSINCFAS